MNLSLHEDKILLKIKNIMHSLQEIESVVKEMKSRRSRKQKKRSDKKSKKEQRQKQQQKQAAAIVVHGGNGVGAESVLAPADLIDVSVLTPTAESVPNVSVPHTRAGVAAKMQSALRGVPVAEEISSMNKFKIPSVESVPHQVSVFANLKKILPFSSTQEKASPLSSYLNSITGGGGTGAAQIASGPSAEGGTTTNASSYVSTSSKSPVITKQKNEFSFTEISAAH